MAAADAALASLLRAVGHTQPLDAEVHEYVLSVVQDPDQEDSLDLLVGVLAECVSRFAALQQERQAELVLQLLDASRSAAPQEQQEPSSWSGAGGVEQQHAAADSSSVSAVVAALRQAQLCEEAPGDGCCADITNTRRRTQSTTGSRASSSSSDGGVAQQQLDVGPLLELCPAGVSSQFLQHFVQHSFQGDMQVAANWLLEADQQQILRQQQAYQQDVQRREQERRETELHQKQQKQLVLAKFDLRLVDRGGIGSGGAGSSKKGGRQPVVDLLPKKAQQQPESKLRYRDGQVVSTKGEKVIIQKVGEEWDGGSRGKVFTKGKRGKGFH